MSSHHLPDTEEVKKHFEESDSEDEQELINTQTNFAE